MPPNQNPELQKLQEQRERERTLAAQTEINGQLGLGEMRLADRQVSEVLNQNGNEDRVFAMPEYSVNSDTVRWLPEGSRKYVKEYQEDSYRLEENKRAILTDANDARFGFTDTLKQSVDEIDAALKVLDEEGGHPYQQDIRGGRTLLDAAYTAQKNFLQPQSIDDLKKLVSPKDTPLGIPKADWEKGMKEADDAIESINTEMQGLIVSAFPATYEYYSRLGGRNVTADELYESALTDGKLDVKKLKWRLIEIGQTPDDTVINGFDPNAANVKDAVLAHLQSNTYNLTNPPGIAANAIVEDAAKEYEKQGFNTAFKKGLSDTTKTAIDAGESWFNYVKGLPGVVWSPELDKQLLRLLNKRTALNQFRDAMETAIEASESTRAKIETYEQQINDLQKEHDIVAEPTALSSDNSPEQARDLLRASTIVLRELEYKYHLSTLSPDIQDVAYWIAMHKGLDSAGIFLQQVLGAGIDPAQRAAVMDAYINGLGADKALLNQYRQRKADREKLSGRDILKPMEQFGVSVHPAALAILNEANIPENGQSVPLNISESRPDNWLNAPEKAGPALESILTSADPQRKEKLIEAFTTGKDVKITVIDPSVPLIGARQITLTAAEARGYILKVREHIAAQSNQYQMVEQLAQHDERFKSALDLLKSGGTVIKDMLLGGDKTEILLAGSMIAAGLYGVYKMWKAGGKDGNGWMRALLLAVPVVLGGDIVVDRMTGRGIFERVGLKGQSKADSASAIEGLIRGNEDEYTFMKNDAGHEAVRQLLNKNTPVPVDVMLEWRRRRGGTPTGDAYAETAPQQTLDFAASRVRSEFSQLEQSGLDAEGKREQSYKYLYMAFDALCKDVARANDLGEPLAENGAELIRDKYVNFTFPPDATMVKYLKMASERQCGFTVMDVLIFEMPTPEIEEARKKYILESGIDLAGKGIDEGKRLGKKTYAYGREKVGDAVDYVSDTASDVIDLGSETANDIYDWLRVTSTKAGAEVTTAADASWKFIAGTASAMGFYIEEYHDDVLSGAYDLGAATVEITVDSLQRFYRELQEHQVTGNILDGLDSVALAVTGTSVSEWALYGDAVETSDEHVEVIAEHLDESLMEDLKSVVDVLPEETKLKEWENNISDMLFEKQYADINDHQKVATYEYLKRGVFSYIVAKRIEAIEHSDTTVSYPLQGIDWNTISFTKDAGAIIKDNALAQGVEDTYGFQTLSLIGAETTAIGGTLSIRENQEGYLKNAFWILHGIVDVVTRDNARQYLEAFDEWQTFFMKKVETEFEALRTSNPQQYEKEIKEYESFLATMLTNSVIEMTMVSPDAANMKDPNFNFTEPLKLTIGRAQNYIHYLRLKRGSAADPTKLDLLHYDFKYFVNEETIPKEISDRLRNPEDMQRIQGVESMTPAVERASLTEFERSRISEMLAAPDLSAFRRDDVMSMATAIGDPAFDERAIRNAFDRTTPTSNEFEDLYPYLLGRSESKVRDIENRILSNADYDTLAKMRAERENNPTEKQLGRLQHAMDRIVVSKLDEIMKRIDDPAAKDEVQNKLVDLYRSTTYFTDGTTDLVSSALEYSLYNGEHDSEVGGMSNEDKYKKFLADHGLNLPTEGTYHHGVDDAWLPSWLDENNDFMGASKRLNRNRPPSALRETIVERIKRATSDLEK